MKSRAARVILFLGLSAVIIGGYQNCSGDFTYNPSDKSISSVQPAAEFGFSIFKVSGEAVDPLKLKASDTYTVKTEGTSIAAIAYEINDNYSGCVFKASTSDKQKDFTCGNSGSAKFKLSATKTNGVLIVRTQTVGVAANPTPSPTPFDINLVEFQISPGTGTAAYNTAANYVLVFVGQTLRVRNTDSVSHRLQSGGTPFANPTAAIAAGASMDLSINSAHENISAGDVRDTNNANAFFFIKSINGATKYSTNCASCHNSLATSEKLGYSATMIRNGINNVGQMRGITLSDDEVAAIAYELNK